MATESAWRREWTRITRCVDCGTPLSRSGVYAGAQRCRPCNVRLRSPFAGNPEAAAAAGRKKGERDRENARLAALAREAGLG